MWKTMCLSPVLASFGMVSLFWEWVHAGQTCPYYGGNPSDSSSIRVAQPEKNLANCSWFENNACCHPTEVTSVFSEMFDLLFESKECENRIHYLMCYFCSPDQEIWFRENKKATICRSFCDSIYEHCADAMFGSKTIKEIFVDKNLQDGGFCKDNFFDVVDGEKDCYKFDPRPFSDTNRLNSNTLLITLISGVHLLTTAAMRYQNTSP